MNSVGVKAPAIHLRDLVFVQQQNTESVTIKRKESEARKSATGRFHDLRSHRFMNGNIVSTRFSCDLSDGCTVLFNAPVKFPLDGSANEGSSPIGGNEQSATAAEVSAFTRRAILRRFARNHSCDGSLGRSFEIREKRPTFLETNARTSLPPTKTTTSPDSKQARQAGGRRRELALGACG
jgi:hypothetical protein